MQGNIRVHARIRPATSGFLVGAGMTDLIQCNSEGEMWLKAEGLVGDHRREAGACALFARVCVHLLCWSFQGTPCSAM